MRRFDASDNEFLILSDGEIFIKKFEIVGLKWKPFITVDDEKQWSLQIYFSDAPFWTVFGDDATAVLKAFDLPTNTPDRR